MADEPQGPDHEGAPADRDSAGRFLPSNKFWRAASDLAGRPRIFETADQLRAACEAYFDWTDDNPLYRDELVTFQGRSSHEPVALMRAMTLRAMCQHMGISERVWKKWRDDREDLRDVIEWAESVIYCWKFEGAAAGQLNPMVITRELGLAEKSELSGPGGGPLRTQEVSARDVLADRIARLSTRRGEGGDTGEPDGRAG